MASGKWSRFQRSRFGRKIQPWSQAQNSPLQPLCLQLWQRSRTHHRQKLILELYLRFVFFSGNLLYFGLYSSIGCITLRWITPRTIWSIWGLSDEEAFRQSSGKDPGNFSWILDPRKSFATFAKFPRCSHCSRIWIPGWGIIKTTLN